MEAVIFLTELMGIVAFAISGAATAIRKELDVVGVIVVAVVTSLGGGLIRDLILGINPPNMFVNETYYVYEAVAVGVGLLCFVAAYFGSRFGFRHSYYKLVLNIADAIGLAVFCVLAVRMAVDMGFGDEKMLLGAVGVITGVGGGATRDIFVGEIPIIFRKYLYATPALIGTLLYIGTYEIMPEISAMLLAIFTIIAIRVLAIIFKWNLPVVKNYPTMLN